MNFAMFMRNHNLLPVLLRKRFDLFCHSKSFSSSTSNYYRKDINRIEKWRYRAVPTIICVFCVGIAVLDKASRRKKQVIFPDYLRIKNELSWRERITFDNYQSRKMTSIYVPFDNMLEKKDISDNLRIFLLHAKGLESYNAENHREAKECFTKTLELCKAQKRPDNDVMVLSCTYYLSLMAVVLEEELEKGLNGLMFCASRLCSARRSELWKNMESAEYFSSNRFAILATATYMRVASNLSDKFEIDVHTFREFAGEAIGIFDEIDQKYGKSFSLFKIEDDIFEDSLAKAVNEILYLELRHLKPGESCDPLQHYVERLNSLQSMRLTPRLGQELNFSKVNEALILVQQNELEPALRKLNILIKSTENPNVLFRARTLKRFILQKLDN